MNALQFLQNHSRAEIERVCVKADTNFAYFRHLAYGNRRPSPQMCQRLEAASEYQLTRAELRPDIYGDPADPCPCRAKRR